MDATEQKVMDEIAGSLRVGWQWDDGVAEWWDDDDKPRITMQISRAALTREVMMAVEESWERGRHRGIAQGKSDLQSDLCRLLNIQGRIDHTLNIGGYVSRHDEA